jgi:hypothetical protein
LAGMSISRFTRIVRSSTLWRASPATYTSAEGGARGPGSTRAASSGLSRAR